MNHSTTMCMHHAGCSWVHLVVGMRNNNVDAQRVVLMCDAIDISQCSCRRLGAHHPHARGVLVCALGGWHVCTNHHVRALGGWHVCTNHHVRALGGWHVHERRMLMCALVGGLSFTMLIRGAHVCTGRMACVHQSSCACTGRMACVHQSTCACA